MVSGYFANAARLGCVRRKGEKKEGGKATSREPVNPRTRELPLFGLCLAYSSAYVVVTRTEHGVCANFHTRCIMTGERLEVGHPG